MKYKFNGNMLEIEDARIIFRNFRGEASKFNSKGNRNFAVIIPNQDIADELIDAGWNVKIKPPREDGESPFMYLPVKISFNNRGPSAYIVSGDNNTRLNEDTIEMLDDVDIRSVNMDLRPYDWEVNGKTGVKAYLKTMYVEIEQDVFASKYDFNNCLDDEEIPF